MRPLALILCFTYVSIVNAKDNKGNKKLKIYKPQWRSLSSRPIPEWYDKAKIGIFIHWGVYSVPSAASEWFWYIWKKNFKSFPREFHIVPSFMSENYEPGFKYQDFAPMFTAEFFNSSQWATLFAKSGAKYVVLTTKHHDGYTLFPSKSSSKWNSVDVGPNLDLVGEVAKAVKEKGLKFGAYYSLFEWYNPIFEEDKSNLFTTRKYLYAKVMPDIKQLIYDYKPSILWSDGDWEVPATYWNSTGLLAWLYNESPVKDEIVVNDRWGTNTRCRYGDFYNCADRYSPRKRLNHKWESCFPLDLISWGYRRTMQLENVMSITALLEQVVSTVSCGGNALINVGPTKEGTIPLIFQEKLLKLGAWLDQNGVAIYDTNPWFHQHDSLNKQVWYTCTNKQHNALHPTAAPREEDNITAFYAIFLEWPRNNRLKLGDVTPYLVANDYLLLLLGETYCVWTITGDVTEIELPDKATVTSEYAWVLKFYK